MDIKLMGLKELKEKSEIIKNLQKQSLIANFEIKSENLDEIVEDRYKKLTENLAKEKCVLFGAFEEDYLTGFTWVFQYEVFGENRIHINQIVVDEKYRRQGIGKQLINSIAKYANERKIDIIDLNVTESNEKAVELYTKLGYVTERRLMKKKTS